MPSLVIPIRDLPVATFTVRHHESKNTRNRPCVHFITFGSSYGPTKVDDSFPTILRLDLSKLEPPPQHLCERFTGQDDEIVKSFFSNDKNEEEFIRNWEKLKQRMKERGGGCVAALINCTAGRHRSVAMAERLATAVRSWDGCRAECVHLDIRKGRKVQAGHGVKVGATELSIKKPERGCRPPRYKAEATLERRVPEERSRGAAATTGGATFQRGSTFIQKKVSWGTPIPVGEAHTQRRNTAGRSAGPLGRDGNQKRLSSQAILTI